MQVRSVMTRHPSVVVRESTVAEAARIMRDRHVAMLPVLNNLCARELVGVITDHDIALRCLAAGLDGRARVGDYMTHEDLAVIDADAAVGDAAVLMSARALRHVPVRDRAGRITGVVALVDLAGRFGPRDFHVIEESEQRISGAHAAAVR